MVDKLVNDYRAELSDKINELMELYVKTLNDRLQRELIGSSE